MTTGATIELVVAIGLIVLSVVIYRRQAKVDSRHGSQGSVLVLVIAIIMAIHALGLLEYRPSQAEIDHAVQTR
jgi:hypothetical protein